MDKFKRIKIKLPVFFLLCCRFVYSFASKEYPTALTLICLYLFIYNFIPFLTLKTHLYNTRIPPLIPNATRALY